MIPYFSVLFAIVFSSLYDKNKLEKIIFIVLCILLIIFSAFRFGGTGSGDYDAYIRLYGLIDSFDKVINPEVHAEIGFRFLSYIGNVLGFEGQFIIAAMAVISCVVICTVIYNYSQYRNFSLLILMPYFLTMNMHSARISVAAAFGLVFFISLYKKNKLLSFLSFIIAVSFHSSAAILVLSFLSYFSIGFLLIISFFLVCFILIISPFEIVGYIFNFIGLNKLSVFLNIYLNSEEYGYPMKMYDPRIILTLGTVFLILLAKNKLVNYIDGFFIKIYILGFIVLLSFSDVTILAWRASYYFLIVGVIVIPALAKSYNDSGYYKHGLKRTASLLFLFLYFLYSAYIAINSEPYKFFI